MFGSKQSPQKVLSYSPTLNLFQFYVRSTMPSISTSSVDQKTLVLAKTGKKIRKIAINPKFLNTDVRSPYEKSGQL